MKAQIKETININLAMNREQCKKIANEFDKLFVELVNSGTVSDYTELWSLKGVFNRV